MRVPFLFAGGNKLVDHGLCAIAEIAELRFPQHECIGVGDGIAIFKTQHAIFAEQRIINPELAFCAGDMAEPVISLSVIFIAQYGMAVGKSSALHILSAHPHILSFGSRLP